MNRQLLACFVGFTLVVASLAAQSRPAPLPREPAAPAEARTLDHARLDRIAGLVKDAIAAKQIPGAVVVVAHRSPLP